MITKRFFGMYKGADVFLYTLTDGISVDICTLGATVTALRVPSKGGSLVDVALGMTNPPDMVEKGDYMGAVVGRCCNRIAGGKFVLNGKTYVLDKNDGNNHLHGGKCGYNSRVFADQICGNSLKLYLVSPDGDQGYSSNLRFCVTYTVSGSDLRIDYFAECDQDTIFSPTNHLYFNLNGQDDGNAMDNSLQVFADEFCAVDGELLPIDKRKVDGTPFDFRVEKSIGRDIDLPDEQLIAAGGYDHNFCLKSDYAAKARSLKTGVTMQVFTDRQGVQVYSGNFLKGQVGKAVYPRRSGFCLETQNYPNAVNRPDFPSPILKKDTEFHSYTIYRFGVEN